MNVIILILIVFLYSLKPQKEVTKERKVTVYDNASEMYNEYLQTYFVQYMALSENKKSKFGNKYSPVNLFVVDAYNYDEWFKNEKLTDTTKKVIKKNLTCHG